MINSNIDLVKYISMDIQKYGESRHFARASRWERRMIKAQPPAHLHPNPDDEFCMEDKGPNYDLINSYCARYAAPGSAKDEKLCEPLIVEKQTSGGYMILNGHDRWAAALKMGIDHIPVTIVNLTHQDDYRKMMEHSQKDKMVIFDFDQVLCATERHPKAEETPYLVWRTFEKRYQERLRKGIPELMRGLQAQGYDVWIYTRLVHSVEYLQSFFKAYHVDVDGIVNGVELKRKKGKEEYRALMERKYKLICNIKQDSILKIRGSEKDFEYYEFDREDGEWTPKVMEVIHAIS